MLRVVGRNPVREVLEREASRVEKILVQQEGGRAVEALRRAAAAAGVPIQYVPAKRLQHEAGGLPHQGVIAFLTPISYHDVDDLLSAIAPDLETVQRTKPMLLLLDGINDPHNFGAILRTAVAAGVQGVIVPTQHMAPVSAAVIKASAGMAMRLPIARVGNLADVIGQLKERGYWVIGAEGEGTTSVWEMDWDRPLALVMGGEGRGMRPRVAGACDMWVSIPMRGDAESLNVSVATGILLFAAARSRSAEAASAIGIAESDATRGEGLSPSPKTTKATS